MNIKKKQLLSPSIDDSASKTFRSNEDYSMQFTPRYNQEILAQSSIDSNNYGQLLGKLPIHSQWRQEAAESQQRKSKAKQV